MGLNAKRCLKCKMCIIYCDIFHYYIIATEQRKIMIEQRVILGKLMSEQRVIFLKYSKKLWCEILYSNYCLGFECKPR